MKTYYHKKILKLAEKFVKKALPQEENIDEYKTSIHQNLLISEKEIKLNNTITEENKKSILSHINEALEVVGDHRFPTIDLLDQVYLKINMINHVLAKQKIGLATMPRITEACSSLYDIIYNDNEFEEVNIDPDNYSYNDERAMPGFFMDDDYDDMPEPQYPALSLSKMIKLKNNGGKGELWDEEDVETLGDLQEKLIKNKRNV